MTLTEEGLAAERARVSPRGGRARTGAGTATPGATRNATAAPGATRAGTAAPGATRTATAAPGATRAAATASGVSRAATAAPGVGRAARTHDARAHDVRAHETRTRQVQSQGMFYALCSVVGVLSLIGLVMVLSASSVLSLRLYRTPWYYFEHQLAWLVLGAAAFLLGVWVNPSFWRRLAQIGMWVSVAMLVAVLVPHVGVAASGASRWLGRGSIQVQPAEFAKLALVFFAADVIDRRTERGDWKYQMVPVLAVMAVLVLLVMKQPDMGTTMVLLFIGFAILFTAGMPPKPILKLLAFGVVACSALAVFSPYRLRRLTAFIHPERNAQGSGYQALQGLAGLGDGGLLGHGIGSSISSWGFLPNAQTDFIFAVIGEETGLVGSLSVASLFVVLAVMGIKVACRSKDRYLALVAAGITAWLTGQAFINISAVVGLLPVTGVPLPFVSFGGSSLVIALFGAGVLAAVAKRA